LGVWIAGALWLAFLFCIERVFESPLGNIGHHRGLAQVFLGLAVVLTFILIRVRKSYRLDQERRTGRMYALSDRRAIMWTPAHEKGGVHVITIRRGQLLQVMRLDFADGSGHATFRTDPPTFFTPHGAVVPIGFYDIPEVRYVADLVRRTLIVPVDKLESVDGA
jgi:hypothetical protein